MGESPWLWAVSSTDLHMLTVCTCVVGLLHVSQGLRGSWTFQAAGLTAPAVEADLVVDDVGGHEQVPIT